MKKKNYTDNRTMTMYFQSVSQSFIKNNRKDHQTAGFRHVCKVTWTVSTDAMLAISTHVCASRLSGNYRISVSLAITWSNTFDR